MTDAYMPKSKSSEWSTPQWLFEVLDAEFRFTVDAAATRINAKCERYWTPEQDGLLQDWMGERVFCNPPFGVKELTAFAGRACYSSCIAVMIVPVKADQQWWHDYALKSEIRFIRGRVTFGEAKSSYPGPIAVLAFGTGRTGCYSMERGSDA